MRVLKFGGSSLGSAESIARAIDIIAAEKQKSTIAVVVSARAGVTDLLDEISTQASRGEISYKKGLEKIEDLHLDILNQFIDDESSAAVRKSFQSTFSELRDVLHGVYLLRELSGRMQDFILSFGERFSAYLLAESLRSKGIDAEYLDARTIIKTDESFSKARVNSQLTIKNIRQHFKDRTSIQIITGFIASSDNNKTTTLGRGGSDYTAAIIGAALGVDSIEKWTDVEGMMTADPKKVRQFFPIPKLSYEEAMELSHFGAKVLYPPTMIPAMKTGIPVRIRNTFAPDEPGTLITADNKKTEPAKAMIRGLSSIDEIALITVKGSGMIGVTGVAARIFNSLSEAGINIILITQASSEHTVCLAVPPEQAGIARKSLENEFHEEIESEKVDEVKVETGLAVIALVGDHMRHTPGISGRVFGALGRNGINVVAIAQGSSERNISIVVEQKNEAKALNVLHDIFFLSKAKTVHLFLTGIGLIGSKLVELIRKQTKVLYEEYFIDITFCGISNSRNMLIDQNGIDLEDWKEQMKEKGEKASLPDFINRMKDLNLSNTVFVDCTASNSVADMYEQILSASISIVTANKKANSGSQNYFNTLRYKAIQHNAAYLYETNVGAGLPVISTLRGQVTTGDKVHKIEGVLSGTLSYLFNSFDGTKNFSDLVKEAQEKGFTEPDPREDLNGFDVGRKLLILAREAGFKLEFDDINIQNLVPEPARKTDDVTDFFEKLKEFDHYFESLRSQAEAEEKKLCYIARFESGEVSVKLEQIDSSHPFYNLSGSDNIVSFTTDHYYQNPMVIKGPGAGADVTASGIIADILRIADTRSFHNEL